MICPNCGEEIDDDAEYCPYCGEEVAAFGYMTDTFNLWG